MPGAAHASDRFERWSYFADRPFDRDRLGDMVKRTLPASLHRCKGPVNTTTTAEPCVLQVVGRRCELTPRSASPPARGRISRIVAIGRDMDTDELDELFAGCLATH